MSRSSGQASGRPRKEGDGAPGAATPSIFVVSDLRLFRDFIALELARDGTVDLVGAAPAAAAAAAQVVALRPDVLLLDVKSSGAQVLPGSLKAYLPDLRVVACAVSGEAGDELAWLKAGVADCIGEECCVGEIVTAIHRAWRGEIACPPALSELLLSDRTGTPAGSGAEAIYAGDLTERERQVLSFVAANLSNKEIARQLGLHPSTVKNYVHRILHKLGASGRREAARGLRHC